jgi:rubredoxin
MKKIEIVISGTGTRPEIIEALGIFIECVSTCTTEQLAAGTTFEQEQLSCQTFISQTDNAKKRCGHCRGTGIVHYLNRDYTCPVCGGAKYL